MQSYWPLIVRGLILITAILLWANVQVFLAKPIVLSASVVPQGLAQGMAIDQIIPSVEVTVLSSTFRAATFPADALQLGFNAAGLGGTPAARQLSATTLPKGVKVLQINPSQVLVSASPAVEKTVPIEPLITHFPSSGFVVSSVVPAPATATIRGSAAVLATISSVSAPINLNNRSGNVSLPSALAAYTTDQSPIKTITIDPATINLTATIEAGNGTRSLGIKPTFEGQLPSGYFVREVIFEPSVVTLSAPQNILSTLSEVISTPIDLTDRRTSFTEKVGVELPRNVLLSGDPLIQARVVIELAESSREFSVSPQFTGLSDNLQVSSSEPSLIQVVLTGDQATLAQLSRNEITLSVDLAGSLSGANTIPLTASMFSVPSAVRVGSFTPATIDVILSRP